MFDMKVPADNDDFEYFEPKPQNNLDDSTLEGCFAHFVKVESLVDKQNLYHCDQCTEDKYGKSKILLYLL